MREAVQPTVPAATKNAGYSDEGVWSDPGITSFGQSLTVTKTTQPTFVYTFLRENAIEYDAAPANLDNPDMTDGEVMATQGEKILVKPNGGTWTCVGWCDHGAAHTTDTEMTVPAGNHGVELGHPLPPTDKVFRGWQCEENVGGYAYVFTAIYDDDTIGIGADPEASDNKADRFQKKLTYQLNNGHWYLAGAPAGSTFVTVLNLWDNPASPDRKPAVNGTHKLAIPLTREADIGYQKQASGWVLTSGDPVKDQLPMGAPPAVAWGNAPAVYTYTYQPIIPVITYNGPDATPDNVPDAATQSVAYAAKIEVRPNGGIWRGNDTIRQLEVVSDVSLENPDIRPGYIFMGWEKSAGADPISWAFTAQWLEDTGNDGIPDVFQKAITFAVVNGTWADLSHSNIVCYAELKNGSGEWDIAGSGTVTVPSNMISNHGYTGGIWDAAIVGGSELTVTASTPDTYTYAFQIITGLAYEVYHWDEQDSSQIRPADVYTGVSFGDIVDSVAQKQDVAG